MSTKRLDFTGAAPGRHWVGDGFPVRSLFTYDRLGAQLSPFLLLDYAGPHQFAPTTAKRGVGEHPHRGFETVTIVYDGEVDHRDSSGGGGRIGPGDVQWMTAASGLVHEEFHSPEFARRGGRFEMVQLWVNLPARAKMSAPRYQGIRAQQIPTVTLPADAGSVRVIAGEFAGTRGPAQTVTPINLWDIRVHEGVEATFIVPSGHTAAIVLLDGVIRLGDERLEGPRLAVLERDGDAFTVRADSAAKLLFLGGEPIAEPIVGYGPFVMDSREGIEQAIVDYQAGRMGSLGVIAGSETVA
jgi:redox-sensitive bicupin YhaK (pirin superfamily)